MAVTRRHQKTEIEESLAGEDGPTQVGKQLDENDEEALSELRPEFGERKGHRQPTATSETTGPRHRSSTAADISAGRDTNRAGPPVRQGKSPDRSGSSISPIFDISGPLVTLRSSTPDRIRKDQSPAPAGRGRTPNDVVTVNSQSKARTSPKADSFLT